MSSIFFRAARIDQRGSSKKNKCKAKQRGLQAHRNAITRFHLKLQNYGYKLCCTNHIYIIYFTTPNGRIPCMEVGLRLMLKSITTRSAVSTLYSVKGKFSSSFDHHRPNSLVTKPRDYKKGEGRFCKHSRNCWQQAERCWNRNGFVTSHNFKRRN